MITVCLFSFSGHCHRSRNEDIDKRARRKLIIASVLCVIFMIGEIVGEFESVTCSSVLVDCF